MTPSLWPFLLRAFLQALVFELDASSLNFPPAVDLEEAAGDFSNITNWNQFGIGLMGVLGNFDHERFCQAAHKRIWAGERHVAAYHAAYREAIYRGSDPDEQTIAPNVRKLRNRKEVKARLNELADISAKLAGIDPAWAMVQLKMRVADFNLDDYLTPRMEGAQRFFDISATSREQLGKLSEITIEEDIVEAGEDTMRKVRKIKLKPYDPASIIGLMARIAGWEAPKKVAQTNPDGDGPAEITVTWKEHAGADNPAT